MDMDKRTASDVFRTMEQSLFPEGSNKQNESERMQARKVFELSAQFLRDNHILKASFDHNASMREAVAGMASVNADFEPARIGSNGIMSLVDKAGIKSDMRDTAAKAVAVLLSKFKACAGNDELYRIQHFSRDKAALSSPTLQQNMTMVYAPSILSSMGPIAMPGQESFGANIDKVLPDIRASLAVTLLQFHRSLLDRIIHRRTSASPYIKYVVPYSEVYDMIKSNDADHMVRNEGEHIHPFIELYGDPRVVSNQLQPIVPLKSNDTNSDLYSDGYIKFNHEVNMFDLSVIATQLGHTHHNYTDLVSENVVVNSVLVKLTKGGVEEIFPINMLNVNGSRLQMQPNTKDSGIRAAFVDYTLKMKKGMKTITGAESTILADTTETDCLRVNLRMGFQINLKYSDATGMGYLSMEPYNVNKSQVAAGVVTLAGEVTAELLAYSLDARFSEENLRKSNLAIRHHIRTFDFEIPNGRNILIDYAFDEEIPEFLMSLVTESVSLGQDHRGIDLIVKELLHVYDVTREENADPAFRSRLDKIGFQYVAAQMVRPVVYLNTIDLDNVDTIRSSDMLGDIRQYVEWELLNLVSLIYQNSYYKHQLKPGEAPVFKCFTSSVILENILSIPHIHDHLNKETPADGSSVEYRRVLPNGTILDCVTVTFDYMRDKIVMIPYRENDPEDILNFGHNWDFGTFVAHYNYQMNNSANKRLFANSRAAITPTSPIGLYLNVKNISKIVDLFQLTAPNGRAEKTEIADPSEILANA